VRGEISLESGELLFEENEERLAVVGMVGVLPMFPFMLEGMGIIELQPHFAELFEQLLGFPFLIVGIERDPDIGKLFSTAVRSFPKLRRNFEVVGVLDVQNRTCHTLPSET